MDIETNITLLSFDGRPFFGTDKVSGTVSAYTIN